MPRSRPPARVPLPVIVSRASGPVRSPAPLLPPSLFVLSPAGASALRFLPSPLRCLGPPQNIALALLLWFRVFSVLGFVCAAPEFAEVRPFFFSRCLDFVYAVEVGEGDAFLRLRWLLTVPPTVRPSPGRSHLSRPPGPSVVHLLWSTVEVLH